MQKVINSDVPLTPQDWGAVVQTLVYDGRIELDPEAQEDEQFRVARLPPQEGSVFAAVPCGICPVRLAADKVLCMRTRTRTHLYAHRSLRLRDLAAMPCSSCPLRLLT